MKEPSPEPSSALSVDSVTGIDVSLAVAGPGARSFAFIIDWHIRLILALAWYSVSALIYNGRLSLAPPPAADSYWFGAVYVPALALYFLYHYVVELAMHGSTPGKRSAGVRIVTRDGGVPGPGALLVRNVFRLIDCLPTFYAVGLLATMVTREHVRIGDMAAGTVLVYQGVPRPLAVMNLADAGGALDARGAELIAELLERWSTLAPAARTRLAHQMLMRYGVDQPAAQASDEAALHEQLLRLVGASRKAPL